MVLSSRIDLIFSQDCLIRPRQYPVPIHIPSYRQHDLGEGITATLTTADRFGEAIREDPVRGDVT